jgi:glycosyltransferase involved in cell wall biosynthesis
MKPAHQTQQPTASSQQPGLRLLAIGTDADLAHPPGRAVGDAHQRQLAYASILAEYRMVLRTLGGRRASLAQGPGFTVHTTASACRATFPLDAFRLGARLHQRFGFDLVSTEDPMLCGLAGYLLKQRFGLPLSVQLAGDMLDNPYWLADRRMNPLLNALGKWLVRRADSVRVVSSAEHAKLIRLGVAPRRIRNLGWMADFAPYQQADGASARDRLLPPPYTRLVLTACRLVKQKDLPSLLRAAAIVRRERPEARFAIAGGGPEEAATRRLAEQLALGDGLLFLGPVPHEQLPAYYAACDVFALSTRYEGNARVLAEAAAAAKPVVTADVSGARDTILDGQTGYVVPVARPDLLAARLLDLLSDSERAANMGRDAQAHVLGLYSAPRLLPGFAELWNFTARRQHRTVDRP